MKFHGDISTLKTKLLQITELEFDNSDNDLHTAKINGVKTLTWNSITGIIDITNTDPNTSKILNEIFGESSPFTSTQRQDEHDGFFTENFLGDVYPNSELVIGLVGAIGSNLGKLTDILKDYLKSRFRYEVEVIRVSSDIIKNHSNDQNIWSEEEFERVNQYMDAGNVLRSRGKDNSFIALAIAVKISEIREKREKDKKKCRVVYIINSLKHDAEIKILRQIYSQGFFQVSLYESPLRRSEYLVKDKGMTVDQANQLIQRDEAEENGHGQHTRDAFHLADYFVKFEGSDDKLRNSCFRFLSLIFGDPFITPTFDEFATFMAFASSLRSADLSRQVGAVIARDETILASGANDIPKAGGGLYWPTIDEVTGLVSDTKDGRDYTRNEDSNSKEKENITNQLTEKLIDLIDKSRLLDEIDSKYIDDLKIKIKQTVEQSKIKDITEYGRVVHAEMETLLACGRERISTKDATLYVTTFPCHNCAKHIIASGIKRIVFVEPYPKSKALDFHRESVTMEFKSDSIKVLFEPFVGVGARNFLNLFSMSLGSGYELKRKNKSGNTLKWEPREAQLRTALLPFSYKEREKEAKKKVDTLRQNVKTT